MSNTVHEAIQPLKDVLDEREKSLKEVGDEAVQDRKEVAEEVSDEIDAKLDSALIKVKGNIAAYMQELEGIPNNDKISEAELFDLALDVATVMGEDVKVEDVLILIGLEASDSYDEFKGLDADTVIDTEEMPEVNRNEEITEDVNSGAVLDKHVLSVYHEYVNDMEEIKTADDFKNFLRDKWASVSPLLEAQYAVSNAPSVADRAITDGQSGGVSGLMNKIMPSQAIAEDNKLESFFNAIQNVGGDVNPDKWVDNGRLNISKMNAEVEMQIQVLSEKVKDNKMNLALYKDAIINTSLVDADKNLTKEGHLTISKMLKKVPEKFYNTSFESEYEAYLENSATEGKVGKGFKEWLSERPKKGGIDGMIDTIKLGMANSGMMKLFKKFFGPDSWIGKLLFKADETLDDAEEDEKFKAQNKNKNRRSWAHEQLANEMVAPSDIMALAWTGVNIEGITVEEGSPNVSAINETKLLILKKVLAPESKCKFATLLPKDKALTLDELEFIEKKATASSETGFTVLEDGETHNVPYDSEKIQEMCDKIDGGGLAKQVGAEHVDKFAEDDLPDGAFKEGEEKIAANLQPAMKSLLDLAPKYWKGCRALSETDMSNFVDKMGGVGGWFSKEDFSNSKDAFTPHGSKFEVSRGLRGNDEYENVEAFLDSL